MGARKARRHKAVQSGLQALIIVHLSSLDSYTAQAGRDKGEDLGWALTEAILGHKGPVVIVDQGWETGYRESRPREALLEAIKKRPDIVWLEFDEALSDWEPFLEQLARALMELRVTSAVVGGIWYNPSLKSGCVSHVYRYLRAIMPTKVDRGIVGCESEVD